MVESNYEERNDSQNLYHKLLWQPMYKVFIGYGINFPISQELLGELKAFIDSVKKVGKYPEGNFFDPNRVTELNKINVSKFPSKMKSTIVSGLGIPRIVGGRGGQGGRGGRVARGGQVGRGGRGGRGDRGGGRGGSESGRKRASVGSSSQQPKRRRSIQQMDL